MAFVEDIGDLELKQLRSDIFSIAETSGHAEYLLRRIEMGKSPHWRACADLVSTRHATWISGFSDHWPGIRLTGKPLDVR